jgi:glycosyltransferase involved in cell wall biosynthesis
MLEAMAVGRPVLVSDAGNMKSVVDETGCGWVLPNRDPATIAGCVRRIVADPAAIEAASMSARRAATDRYSSGARRAEIDAILTSVSRG